MTNNLTDEQIVAMRCENLMALQIQQRGEAVIADAIDLLQRNQDDLDEDSSRKAWNLIPELQQQFADLKDLITLPEPSDEPTR